MADVGISKIGPDLWLVRVARRDSKTGRVVNRKERVKGTKRDALETRDRLRAELRDGSTKLQRMRLADYVRSWLASRVEGLKPSVSARYAAILDLHILPALGAYYLDAITPTDIKAYVAARARKEAAGNTVLGELRLLRVIARDSLADRVSTIYWCDRVEPPKTHTYTEEEPNLLTAEQLGALLAALRPQWRAIVLLLATTGLRWGEATGLRWEDLDVKAGVVRVRRSNWRGVITDPKTKRSTRTVPLLPEVIDLLGKAGPPSSYVFLSRAGGLYKHSALRKPLRDAMEAAGLGHIRITTHGLRRTFNDLARRVGSAQVVKSITGHVTDQMLEHYSLVDHGEKTAVSRRVLDGVAVPNLSRRPLPPTAN